MGWFFHLSEQFSSFPRFFRSIEKWVVVATVSVCLLIKLLLNDLIDWFETFFKVRFNNQKFVLKFMRLEYSNEPNCNNYHEKFISSLYLLIQILINFHRRKVADLEIIWNFCFKKYLLKCHQNSLLQWSRLDFLR